MNEQVTECLALFTGSDNTLSLVSSSALFVLFMVFAFIKKSLPSFVKEAAVAVWAAINKKK